MSDFQQLSLFGDSLSPMPVGSSKKKSGMENQVKTPPEHIIDCNEKAIALLPDAFLQQSWLDLPFLSLDTETTGLNHAQHRVIEIAWIHFEKQTEHEAKSHLCSIDEKLPFEIIELTGITDAMLQPELPFSSHVENLFEAMKNVAFVVAYNANFDRLFVQAELARLGKALPQIPWIDPCVFIRELDRYQKSKKLKDATWRWGVPFSNAHRALADARASGLLLYKLASRLKPQTLLELVLQQKTWQEEQDKSYKAYLASKKL